MDYSALYAYRFKDVNLDSRKRVWEVISQFIYELADKPERVLDPACGLGEFINSCPAPERWASDLGMSGDDLDPEIKFEQKSFFDLDVPDDYFDLIFLSNVLEHLETQASVNEFLVRARAKLRHGGRLIIMGPNFKYCADEYFDCADHTTILTHVSVAEHLVAAGMNPLIIHPKFLPFSFRSRLPSFPWMTSFYLHMKPMWRILGKQFLVVGAK